MKLYWHLKLRRKGEAYETEKTVFQASIGRRNDRRDAGRHSRNAASGVSCRRSAGKPGSRGSFCESPGSVQDI